MLRKLPSAPNWSLLLFALTCFASNSLLCTVALRPGHIDPLSFTSIRLLSGAVMLSLMVWTRNPSSKILSKGDWKSGATLFIYAMAFSLAYVRINAGVGALILFGTVQITMLIWNHYQKTSLNKNETIGLIVAVVGLAWLVIPGASSPDLMGVCLMIIAGLSWGLYSLNGIKAKAPLHLTAGNFGRAAILSLFFIPFSFSNLHLSSQGIETALISGALTSGVAYAIWYTVLPHLKPTLASIVQLAVPVLAAAASILFLGEKSTLTLLFSSAMVLGGIAIVIFGRREKIAAKPIGPA
ncbi:MAG: DMT family transporter [Bdellovibrionota bacterium]